MAVIICPDCGKEQDSLNKFCRNCGADLSNVEAIPEVEENISSSVDGNSEVSEVAVNDDAEGDSEVSEELAIDSVEEEAKESDINKCPNCGEEIAENHNFCPNCGADLGKISKDDLPQSEMGTVISSNDESVVDSTEKPVAPVSEQPVSVAKESSVTTRKQPIVSAILSLIFPGLGQLYNGQNKKGIYFLIIAIVSVVLMLLIVGIILYILFWLWSIFDAYSSTVKLNNGEFVEDKLF